MDKSVQQPVSRGINDPVHGWTNLESYLIPIIDTPLFQRLGYVTQLTLSNKVFPSANHTRREHSIGVMNLAGKYADHLFKDKALLYDVTKTKQKLQIAALCHDIGHGPYSHSWDRSIYCHIYPDVEKGHDQHRKRIIDSVSHQLDEIDLEADDIIDSWENNLLHRSILQGPMGCDRMDFIRRDATYCASQHFGYYDIDRIIQNSSLVDTPNGCRLLYNEKIFQDLVQALETRNKMYESIYYHKTTIALQLLLETAIDQTKDTLKFVERTKNIEQFQYLTDAILFEMMPHSQEACCIYTRKFPKMMEQQTLISSDGCYGMDNIDGIFTWTSPIITNNFEPEFTKHDIYIKTRKGDIMKFQDYWKNQRESLNVTSWQIHRTYQF